LADLAGALLRGGAELSAGELVGVLATGLGVPMAAVMLGEAGCVVHSGSCRGISGREDGNGGHRRRRDAFGFAFAVGIVAGVPVAEAVQAAQAAAARAVLYPGGYE
jgi:hypothetical protein